MSKYSRDELRTMAQQALFNPESDKFMELVMTLVQKTRLHPNVIIANIQALAQ